MLQQVITPTKENPTFTFPPEYYGQEVKVLIFPTSGGNVGEEESEKKKRVEKLMALFDTMRVDLSDYKFDRDEANNYD